MPKGFSVRFTTYEDTIPKILKILKLDEELKKHSTIILKPSLTGNQETSTPPEFIEPVIQFCIANKNPVSDIFIAEGADGHDTMELFEQLGYNQLAEKYAIGLLDINTAEAETIDSSKTLRFEQINFPTILKDAFIITLPKLHTDEVLGISGALASMLGAFPAKHYKGLFTSTKSKLHRWPIQYAVHDITQIKMPDLAITDASEQGVILAGQPLAVDKQSAKLLGLDIEDVPHLELVNDSAIEAEAIPE